MDKSLCDKGKELIRCFCGCSDLSVEEVRQIYRASAEQILNTDAYRKLLKNFLKSKKVQSSEEATLADILLIYEKCLEYQQRSDIDEDDIDELAEYGITFNQEKHLREAFISGNLNTVKQCLDAIKADYRNQTESSEGLGNFRRAMLDKLTRRNLRP